MPKKGYKSITLKKEIYNFFFTEWLKVKDEYTTKKGIKSFSAYITNRLAEMMNEEQNQTRKENNKSS